jgi:hypothetical protein
MKLSRRTTLIATLLATATLSVAWAAQPGRETYSPGQPMAKDLPATAEGCAAMKGMCDEAMANQKTSDAQLDRLLTTMNDATGQGKVDAMAAVINELVKQRDEGRKHMMHMDAAMKGHMMQHVMASAPADMCEKMKKGMDGCSMMHGPADAGR